MSAARSRSRGDVSALVNSALDQSLLLPFGAVVALVWANLAHDSYEELAHGLHFAVNDIGMVFFFGLAAKEVVEAMAPDGALHSMRQAATPVLAAVGGMLGPALAYLALGELFNAPQLRPGWAIPCATDIAFSYLVARFVLGTRHPGVAFLLLLAIADDAFGLVILAVFYPVGVLRLGEFALLFACALAVAWGLRHWKVLNFWPYVLGAGGLCWLALFRGGLHPALALVPIVPFLPHAKRDPGLFVEAPEWARDTLSAMEHWWRVPVQFILLFFGLANAGVELEGAGVGTVMVLGGVLIGKPVGIVTTASLAKLSGLHFPRGLTERDLVVVSFAAAIGFTVALFFATAAFPVGSRLLDETKMGALLSVSGGILTVAAAAALRVGRFAPTSDRE
jgi:NhaA family Na+:H+ antiporter